jgi:invasion protein IalB
MQAVQRTIVILLIAPHGSLPLAADPTEDAGWRKVCSVLAPKNGTPPGQSANSAACYTYLPFIDKPTKIRLGSIGILSRLEADETWLLLMLPLASASPFSPSVIETDQGSRIWLHFPETACERWGCIEIAKLDAASLSALRAAKQFALVSTDVTGKEWRFSVSAEGLAKAFDGEPIREEAMSQEEKSVQQFIRSEGASLMASAK